MSTETPPTGPVTLVTGGNKGLGYETARRLKGLGHQVWLGARDETRGRAAAEQLDVRFVQLDVTSDESVDRAVAVLAAAHGRLDVLINNAGLAGPRKAAHEYTAADAAEVFGTNVVGNVRVTHACMDLLKNSANPVIVNVSSGNGSFTLFGDPDRIESRTEMPLYGASKAAINMLTARYARMMPHARINAADPGRTATDLSGGQGHSVADGTDAIVELACLGPDGPTGTFRDRDGVLPW